VTEKKQGRVSVIEKNATHFTVWGRGGLQSGERKGGTYI
jgi:hypothetical protein